MIARLRAKNNRQGSRVISCKPSSSRSGYTTAIFTVAMMSQRKEAVLQRLLQVVNDLYGETAGLSAEGADLQLWYNRGYADGMVDAMRSLGYAQSLSGVTQGEHALSNDADAFLPWGKAYRHGFETGGRETLEVLGEG